MAELVVTSVARRFGGVVGGWVSGAGLTRLILKKSKLPMPAVTAPPSRVKRTTWRPAASSNCGVVHSVKVNMLPVLGTVREGRGATPSNAKLTFAPALLVAELVVME